MFIDNTHFLNSLNCFVWYHVKITPNNDNILLIVTEKDMIQVISFTPFTPNIASQDADQIASAVQIESLLLVMQQT